MQRMLKIPYLSSRFKSELFQVKLVQIKTTSNRIVVFSLAVFSAPSFYVFFDSHFSGKGKKIQVIDKRGKM